MLPPKPSSLFVVLDTTMVEISRKWIRAAGAKATRTGSAILHAQRKTHYFRAPSQPRPEAFCFRAHPFGFRRTVFRTHVRSTKVALTNGSERYFLPFTSATARDVVLETLFEHSGGKEGKMHRQTVGAGDGARTRHVKLGRTLQGRFLKSRSFLTSPGCTPFPHLHATPN
jgi:hypothetical protein